MNHPCFVFCALIDKELIRHYDLIGLQIAEVLHNNLKIVIAFSIRNNNKENVIIGFTE